MHHALRAITQDGEQQFKVDMRSKSRLGKGDLGANAARIIAYLQRLEAALAEAKADK